MQTASRYELLDRIAIGGMAELFRARIVGEQGFSKVVAIKRILPQFAGDEHFVRMLIDEARTASHLSHPNIAEVHELRRDADGGLFIALEYVSGPSLAGLLGKLGSAGKHLPEACALDVAIHLLEALDHAHAMTDPAGRPLGVVHRDVSPDNVLVTREGTVKLTDFGVAKARGRLTTTQQGTIKGKLAYMSPEQVRGLEIDARSDQFAAGLVLWEALTGRTHYDASTDFELMKQVADGQSRPLADAGISVAKEIQAALDRALAPTPEERFPRCADFAKVLATYHHRTWPGYSRAELGKLVEEFYKERFDLLAERLRRFEEGKEKPVGMINLATDPAVALLATPDEGASTDTGRQASPAPKAGPRKVTKDPNSKSLPRDSKSLPRDPNSKSLPRKVSKAEVPKPRAKAPVEAAPAEEPKKAERKEQDAEVEKALAAAKKDDKGAKGAKPDGAKKSSAMSVLASVFLFLAAVGGGIGGMAWLRGTGFSLDLEDEPVPLPQPATPLVRPDEPAKDPKERPQTPKGSGLGKSAKEVKVGEADPNKKPGDGTTGATGATGTTGEATAPAAPAGKGTIDIECIPEGCEAELDGSRAMPTPLTREVAAGVHKVRLIHRLIGARKEITVEVAPNKTTTRSVNLVTGR